MNPVFKCPNCSDEPLPASEVPCWKCGSWKVQAPIDFIDACGLQQKGIDASQAGPDKVNINEH